jgi:putative hydrolase of the HAD superfamily
MPTRAILFDFFGTLVEYSHGTAGLSFAESHACLAECGTTIDEPTFLTAWGAVVDRLETAANQTHVEFAFSAIVDGLLADLGVAAAGDGFTERFSELFLGEWNAGVRYHNWLGTMVAELSEEYRLGVVTNTYHPTLVPRHLERMGIAGHFEVVVKSHDLGTRKPAAAVFEHALGEMGLTAEETVFVGDSYVADFIGPRSVGMSAFLIDPGGRQAVPPEWRLSSLAELPLRLQNT